MTRYTKHFKKIIVSLLIVALLFMTGCSVGQQSEQSIPIESANGSDSSQNQQQSNNTENGTETTGTRIIEDSLGRQVEVPYDAERIAALYSFAGYAVTMLGKGDKIVATPNGLKRDAMVRILVPSIMDALVPRSSGVINAEELINANPDLIIVRMQTGLNEAETAKLDLLGIPYVVVDFNNIEEQQKAIAIVGDAINRQQEAADYNAYYQDAVERVSGVVQAIPHEERVRLYHSINDMTRTAASGTLAADWSIVAGANNVSVGQNLRESDGDYHASIEQILTWNPQVVFANEQRVVDYIKENSQWSPIEAVKNNQVYKMPHGLSRWGHPDALETPITILWAAKTLYPDKFQDLDIGQEIVSFFERFFDYSLTSEEVKDILSGEGMRDEKK
jgi:iron complex transport system substrate-binding protein